MGESGAFQPHKLIVAVLFAAGRRYEQVRDQVGREFGPIDRALPPQPFHFSSYYDEEMGSGLQRTLFSIGPLVDPCDLAAYKERSNRIERDSSDACSRRSVNLDPGLLSLSRIILATTKPSAHRIPLRDGISAEITLIHRHGRYTPLEWTYPDYRSEGFVIWLGGVRDLYHDQLRGIDPGRPWRL